MSSKTLFSSAAVTTVIRPNPTADPTHSVFMLTDHTSLAPFSVGREAGVQTVQGFENPGQWTGTADGGTHGGSRSTALSVVSTSNCATEINRA